MSSYTRRFNYLIFMASILLVLLCFLATGTVYADQVAITNEKLLSYMCDGSTINECADFIKPPKSNLDLFKTKILKLIY